MLKYLPVVMLALCVGCTKQREGSEASGATTTQSGQSGQKAAADPEAPMTPEKIKLTSARAEGPHYTVTLTPAPCTAKQPCSVDITIEAKGDYHLNEEYPYRVRMHAAPEGAAKWLGKEPPNQFSKSGGDFEMKTKTLGILKTRFQADNAGSVHVAGVLKFSVCSSANCEIENKEIGGEIVVH